MRRRLRSGLGRDSRGLVGYHACLRRGNTMFAESFHSGGMATAWIPSGPSVRVGA